MKHVLCPYCGKLVYAEVNCVCLSTIKLPKSLNHDRMPLKLLVLFADRLLFFIPAIPWSEINQPLKL